MKIEEGAQAHYAKILCLVKILNVHFYLIVFYMFCFLHRSHIFITACNRMQCELSPLINVQYALRSWKINEWCQMFSIVLHLVWKLTKIPYFQWNNTYCLLMKFLREYSGVQVSISVRFTVFTECWVSTANLI